MSEHAQRLIDRYESLGDRFDPYLFVETLRQTEDGIHHLCADIIEAQADQLTCLDETTIIF